MSQPFDPTIPVILPHEQVFNIQVGDSLFRLSGASLSSDAPSYFTQFFSPYKDIEDDTKRPILYLDRSAKVFKKIAEHLQGYYIRPDNSEMYSELITDARYYGLPRLIKQLASIDVFCRIGGREFQIPIDIFDQPGDKPNFFTLAYKTWFGSERDLREELGLIRPPPAASLALNNRSPNLFEDLLRFLVGDPIEVRSDEHRKALLRECNYYRFKGLEQRLIACRIDTTMGQTGEYEEITLNFHDIKPKEISTTTTTSTEDGGNKILCYTRPYINEPPRQFIFQLKNELISLVPHSSQLFLQPSKQITRNQMREVFGTVCAITNAQSTGLKVSITSATDLKIDNIETNEIVKVTFITNSLWRFLYRDDQIVLELIKGEGYTTQKVQNKMREFI